MCSENQYADEWIPVFISLLEVTRETIHINETTDRFRAIVFHLIFSTLPKSIKIKRWLSIREQCLKLMWTVIIRCLASPVKISTDDEQNKFVLSRKIFSSKFLIFIDHQFLFSVGYNIHLLVKHYFNVQYHQILIRYYPIQLIEYVYKMQCRLFRL
jgi:hypothetical protein